MGYWASCLIPGITHNPKQVFFTDGHLAGVQPFCICKQVLVLSCIMAARRIGKYIPDWVKISTRVPAEARADMGRFRTAYEGLKTRYVVKEITCISLIFA